MYKTLGRLPFEKLMDHATSLKRLRQTSLLTVYVCSAVKKSLNTVIAASWQNASRRDTPRLK